MGCFYQKFWPKIGSKILETVYNILNNNHSTAQINHTLIALVPKTKSPQKIDQYRPISLCNTIYKLASKTLANRLKPIVNTIILPTQSAFVPRRIISDNTIPGFESIHKLRAQTKGKKGLCAVKLDMFKAYDRVEWRILRVIMLKMGFDINWMNKIMDCVTSATFSVNVNGHSTDHIIPHRGLRQGCLLSPYLFLLCSEGLTSLINAVEREGQISSLKISRLAPPITHLLFADDCLIFIEATREETNQLKHILNL